MEDWKEYKYTELASLIGGGTPKTTEASYWNGNIPWLSVKDFCGNSKYVYKTEKHITELGLRNSSTKLLHRGDIIISARGTVGEIAMLPYDMAFNQSCFGIRANVNVINNHYLYYLTKTKVRELQNSSHGSVFDTITKDTFENINCYIPNINEQIKIAAILSSLDDKIELNRRINGNLEQQAQTLFNHYFIERPDLLGKYKISNLTGIANYLNGLAMQKFRPQIEENGIPVLKIKELGQGYTDASSDICSENIADGYKVHNGDVIFSWSGTLMVKIWCGGLCGLNQHLFKVSSEIYPKWFYYFWTKHHLNKFIRIAQDKAVTMGHIKRNDLEASEILIPQMDILAKLDAIISPLFSQIIEMKCENRNLAAIRDILLPQLMSGKLKINDLNR
ncbi:restriction endonuclease subunit S [Bacteroides gallinaceum]|uniref:restriction endonuclease subunit S n=1 Tax=Bacteroides gallinaceum TaxID=1462571 RepID=UPI0025A49845|nr:restriction endonuclease subunit S [Bacteroides gallinaceum]MDM8206602.1 restriction endonuclease subunit S [Bacteroides gallinaceum]